MNVLIRSSERETVGDCNFGTTRYTLRNISLHQLDERPSDGVNLSSVGKLLHARAACPDICALPESQQRLPKIEEA